jgi:hypothetical protein
MFSLFSPNTAGNYAASFRQVEPVPGFSNVKEDRFSEMLANLPVEKYKQEMAFAREALGEVAATKRANDQLDYYRERDALENRQNRISNLVNFGRNTAAQVANVAIPVKRSPYDTLLSVAQAEDALSESRRSRMAGSRGGLAEALKGLGPLPSMSSDSSGLDASSLFQSTSTYAAPKPGSLDDVTKQVSIMELFEQAWNKTGSK